MPPEMDPSAQDRARQRQKRQEKVQRRRLALVVGVILLVVLIVGLAVGLSGRGGTATASSSSTTAVSALPSESGTYSATLTGGEAVPVVKTTAQATFVMEYDSQTKQLSWTLQITKALGSPTSAVIYKGAKGTTGAAVYTLWVAEEGSAGSKLGLLGEQKNLIDASKLVGPLQGGTIAGLIQLIKSGNAYVSVGNKTHPVDAIRGQLE